MREGGEGQGGAGRGRGCRGRRYSVYILSMYAAGGATNYPLTAPTGRPHTLQPTLTEVG
jgi:hypothetical protein